jgi:uncharacterized protein YkwD
MGIESRDWYREDPVPYLDDVEVSPWDTPTRPDRAGVWPSISSDEAPSWRGRQVAPFAIGLLFLVVGIAGAIVFGRVVPSRTVEVGPLFGPTITIQGPLYAANDPWQGYLADERTCPGGENESAPLQQQANTMVCLINYARGRHGLTTLHVAPVLSTAAQLKGEQIARCRVFAHAPCGGDPHDVADQAGYAGAFGENLYIAEGRHGAPRVALDGWLNSPGHRENVFRPRWRVQSLYVVKLGRFNEYRGATLWVSHFGDR